jgi:hypothetical protein
MRAMILATYDLKRMMRHKAMVILLLALPLAVGLFCLFFPQIKAARVCVWACPVVCAALTWGILWVQRTTDKASGLLDGLLSTPLTETELDLAHILAGAAILFLQVVILGLVLIAKH